MLRKGLALGVISSWGLWVSCVTDVEKGAPSIQSPTRPQEAVKPQVQQGIEAMVGQKLSDLQVCYDAEKQIHPEAKGRILVGFLIEADGRVSDPRIEYSSFQSPVFEGCVLGRIESWTFPKPSGAQALKVRYPFGFGM